MKWSEGSSVFMLLVLAASGNDAAAAGEGTATARGLWFWGKPASPWGATSVIGNVEAETEALATFQRWNVRRLYGSYGVAPVERPAVVGAWNGRLHAAGIRSESLFSDNGAITDAGRRNFLNLVRERVVEFNRRCPDAAMRFNGIALDIEPHATPQWKTATPEARREMLEQLLLTCTALRELLDAHDARELTISAALAYWLERLPPEGRVGWRSEADRDQWFARLAGSVASISLMAYERSRGEAILEAVTWERAHFPGRTIIALRARLGVEWKSLADLTQVLPIVEAGDGMGVDLENYELLRLAEAAAAKR